MLGGVRRLLLVTAAAVTLPMLTAGCEADGSNDAPEFTADPGCFGAGRADGDPGVQCGVVDVPLDHDDPGGERIDVATVVVDGQDDGDEPPLLVLGGGPGQAVVEPALADEDVLRGYGGGRETILVDQRGAGASDPALECPELEGVPHALAVDSVDALVAGLTECRSRLEGDGVDLNAFNHRNNGLDVHAVRAALGHEEIDVRGGSYGAHLALHAAALDPAGIRALVLVAPVDPTRNFLEQMALGFGAALDHVVDACEATEECAAQVGDLEEAIAEVVDRLATEPERPGSAAGDERAVTATAFVDALFALFYQPDGAMVLPALVDEARAGDLEPLVERLEATNERLTGTIALGMLAAMVCSGEGALVDVETVSERLASQAITEHWLPYTVAGGEAVLAACQAWDLDLAFDPAELDLAEDVPALLVAGEVDAVAPPWQARAVADAVGTAHFIEVPGAGHSPLATLDRAVEGCSEEIIQSFLADPNRPPADGCVDAVPPFTPVPDLSAGPG